jgi:Predicted O-methyltransferase
MHKHQELLLSQISNLNNLNIKTEDNFLCSLSPQDLAGFFVNVTMLTTALEYFKEERWLHRHQPGTFSEFMDQAFHSELMALAFLADKIENSSEADLKQMAKQVLALEQQCIKSVRELPFLQQKDFAREALQMMAALFSKEADLSSEKKSAGAFLSLSLYRSFDGLDEIFGLNYQADHGMKTDLTIRERLYEGAGVGVQSSYSTLLNTLRVIAPSQGSRFIDLGSGYGRVGLVVGLMRPDIDFVGYEYVGHRVDIAENIAHNLEINKHVQFLTQDLADSKFQIPDAEVYYMYDPFSEETYRHVLNQLIEVSKRRQITIVTKGNAQSWLRELALENGWEPGQQFDGDSLSFFKSKVVE